MKIYYNPKIKKLASELRKNATYSERLLWKHLKASQMLGYRFTRQKPIEQFIVDFFCPVLHLVIEIDGITHNGKVDYDACRDEKLKAIGLTVLRINAQYVVENINGTLRLIEEKVREMEKAVNEETTP